VEPPALSDLRLVRSFEPHCLRQLGLQSVSHEEEPGTERPEFDPGTLVEELRAWGSSIRTVRLVGVKLRCDRLELLLNYREGRGGVSVQVQHCEFLHPWPKRGLTLRGHLAPSLTECSGPMGAALLPSRVFLEGCHTVSLCRQGCL